MRQRDLAELGVFAVCFLAASLCVGFSSYEEEEEEEKK